MFISRDIAEQCGWQAFERLVARLLVHKGFSGVRVVGGAGDKGADIIGHAPSKKRWLIQAKYWRKPVPEPELQKTLEAARVYGAEVAIVVALNGVDEKARAFQRTALSQGRSLSVWGVADLIDQVSKLPTHQGGPRAQGDYQEAAIAALTDMLISGSPRVGMVVMATGLGKTFTAAEAIRRCGQRRKLKVLVLAHTNQLVLQLEKAFWPFIGPSESTAIWNQTEKPSNHTLEECRFIFGSRDTVANYVASEELPRFDLILIDECHHAHSLSASYQAILAAARVGHDGGCQLVGLTATPFLTDPNARLAPVFGESPLVSVDMVYGLTHGFLSRLDYRLFTDNINWDGLRDVKGNDLSPRAVNRAFFVREWDDGVITELQKTWFEIPNPKVIVFCGTVEHAVSMKDKINARGFCRAEAIYSGSVGGHQMTQYERNLALADFEIGRTNVICTVDIFNEGIDVPDVNIVVFNRVTHSRRIFIQQLGRGLRISEGKEVAIALDFAQDIRRYAAGIKLKDELSRPARGTTVVLGNKVEFRNASGEDRRAESFLKAWLSDVESIEAAGDDDAGILKYPPSF